MAKALVTGGAGFIGSHLVDRLLAAGHSVLAVDNLVCGTDANLAQARRCPDFRLKVVDVADRANLATLFDGIDWVFHLAALADIVPSIQRPATYHEANVNGTIAVLEASRAAGVKRFVYAASSSCYGIPDIYPTPESAEMRPMYPYALTKYVGEQYVMHWAQTYQLPAVSLRFFNVYGPRARTNGTYGAVFGVFLAQKLAGLPYTVVGDGTQTRDFTFVSDVVSAIVMAAESRATGICMNVGSGNTYSINRLVELLGGPVTHIPRRPGEPQCTFADSALIRKILGWSPQVTFEEGIAKMLASIDYWKTAPVWTPERIREATADWFKYLGAAG
jgi:UDP-glucose 4-epimerase